jgi:hypothetical protein
MMMLEKRVASLEALAGIHDAEYVIVIRQHSESREQALARAALGRVVRPIFVDFLNVGAGAVRNQISPQKAG